LRVFFKDKNFYYPFILWFIIVFWYLIFAYSFFNLPRLKFGDIFTSQAFYFFSQPPQEVEKIVLIAIDEASRRNLNLKWPWKRSKIAQLIENIASFSPRIIGLDIIFSGVSDNPQEDIELATALRSHPNIVLGYVWRREGKDLPEEFIKSVHSVGFINKPPDPDEVIRNTRTFIAKDNHLEFSLEIKLIASYLGVSFADIKVEEEGIWIGDEFLIPTNKTLARDKQRDFYLCGITPINYQVHPARFDTIPAYLLLEKKLNSQFFEDKIKDKLVLVGVTDPLLHDEHLTPLGIFPGVAIIGNSVVMMLSKRFVYNPSLGITFLIILILGILIIFVNKRLVFAPSSLVTFLILFSVFVGAIYLRSKDIQFDYFTVFFLSLSSYIVVNTYKYSYLIYMSNRLKKLAITDPLTGFYTPRYFLLKLDEELKDTSKSLAFLALIISNYKRLMIDLNFEELKSAIKLLAEYTEVNLRMKFKKINFSRLSQDIFGIALWEEKRETIESSFRKLLEKLKKVEFKVENKVVKVYPLGILIYKPKGRKTQSKEITYNMESSLKELRKKPELDYISLDLEEKIWEAKREGLKEDILDFLVTDLEERNKELEKTLGELLESKRETEEAYFETIRSLIKALEEKDTYTSGHSERVAKYASRIAEEANLPPEERELIYKAALLHDIGKIGIPDYLLHKEGKLTEEEMNIIKRHQLMSVEILKPIKPFEELLPIILYHHEHFDGGGYPHGLSGDMIPRGAQILAVADAFDAITCGRGYKKGMGFGDAIKELEKNSGTQFNPIYIEAFKKAISSHLPSSP
jgi:putative nucleotidyltransferase with HDIG domain